MDYRYHVTIQSDGLDCDGPITHGIQTKTLTYSELASEIGFALLRHGHVSTEMMGDNTLMIFSHKHDEGFSRTSIEFVEIQDQDDDDSVAGYSLSTGEPVYR